MGFLEWRNWKFFRFYWIFLGSYRSEDMSIYLIKKLNHGVSVIRFVWNVHSFEWRRLIERRSSVFWNIARRFKIKLQNFDKICEIWWLFNEIEGFAVYQVSLNVVKSLKNLNINELKANFIVIHSSIIWGSYFQ